MLKTRQKYRALALLLAVLMLFSQTAMTTSAGEVDAGNVITSFNALAADVAAQSVAVGTAESALTLPDTLDTTIDGKASAIADIIWASEPVYDGGTSGTYTFTAVLPDAYTVADGVSVPAITVTVEPAAADTGSTKNTGDGTKRNDKDNTAVGAYENSVSGFMWLDMDMDGTYDADEPPVAGFTVSLYAENNRSIAVDTATTGEDGSYTFGAIVPGDYVLGIQAQTIDDTEYLLPVLGITADNKFKMDTETYTNAYTAPIEIGEDMVVAGIDAGLRTSPKIQPMSVLNVTVNNGTEVTITNLAAGNLGAKIQAIVDDGEYSSITAAAAITKLTVTGSMNEADLDYIWKGSIHGSINSRGNLTGLRALDMSSVTLDGGTSLPNYQFAYSSLTNVTLPNDLTSIGEGAFKTSALMSIYLPSSLTSIGDDAFNSCSNLMTINLSNCPNLSSIGNNVFTACRWLHTIDLSGCTSLTSIGNEAFSSCQNLTSISLPDSLTSIGNSTFRKCSKLGNIDLPDSLTSVGDYAFAVCVTLTAINVTGGNTSYSSIDGVLFNKNGDTLIAYPSGKSDSIYTIPNAVTTIATGAFIDCPNLTSVNVPGGLTSIGESAFQNCTSLGRIDLSGCTGLTSIVNSTFQYCTNLDSIDLPDGLVTIGDSAFSSCSSLQKVDLSHCAGLTTIGNSAFSSCSSLQKADLSHCAGLTSIGESAFRDCTDLADIDLSGCAGLTTIGDSAFYACSSLQNIDLSGCASLTSIGESAFRDCTELADIDLSGCASLTSIGAYTFINCSDLTSIDLPAGLTSIGNYTFYECMSLTTINLPESLTTIGNYTFYDCMSLTTIDLPESLTTIGNYTFSGSGLTDIDLSTCNSMTSIGSNAFRNCTSLTSIELSVGLTSIASSAFRGCTSLTSLDLSGYTSLATIGNSVFRGCTNLNSLDLSDCTGLITIGSSTFYDCGSLSNIDLSGIPQVISITNNTFNNTDGIVVTVLQSLLSNYQGDSDWSYSVSAYNMRLNGDDTTPPTGEITVKNNSFASFLNTITFGLFFKNSADVEITGSDASGITSIEYYKTDAAKTEEDLTNVTWELYTGSFSVNEKEKFIIYAKIIDNAGNSTIISSDGMIVYTDSEATVDGGSFSKASTDDLAVTVTMNGNTVKSITNGSYTLIAGTDYTTGVDTITFKNIYLKNLADGTYNIFISWYPLGVTETPQANSDTPGTTTITIDVNKADQNALSITGLGSSYTYGDPSFDLATSGGSGTGAVTFTSSDSSVASVSGNTVTIHKAGTFTITATKAADASYNEVTVSSGSVTVSEATPAVTKEYKFTTAFGTFTGSGDLTGKIGAPYAKFVKLLIDGKEVDSRNYTVTEGSTVITLKEAYLKTLANGKYTVTANFTDGVATTTMTVNVSNMAAKTGDNSTLWPWLALLGASGLGIVGIALTRKRKLFAKKGK